MYDEMLRQDLISYKASITNINDIPQLTKDINKILNRRTNDKIFFIKMLLTDNIIGKTLYDELYSRIQNDYKKASLYIRGWCQI